MEDEESQENLHHDNGEKVEHNLSKQNFDKEEGEKSDN